MPNTNTPLSLLSASRTTSMKMAEQRKRGSVPSSSAAQALLQPIVPANSNGQNDKPSDDLCSEAQKKLSVTPWKARRQRFWFYFKVGLLIMVISFTSRGYHRRNQNSITRKQRREWMKFRTKHKIDENNKKGKVQDADFSSKDTFLAKNPKVARKWDQQLKQNQDVREAFAEDSHNHPMFKPRSFDADPVDWTANYLGEAVENAGSYLKEQVAEPVLGKSMAQTLGNVMHDTIDIFGDFADDHLNTASLQEVPQALYESGQSFLEQSVLPLWSASADSVSEWMAGVSSTDGSEGDEEDGGDASSSSSSSSAVDAWSWTNWTQGFISKAQSSASTLWNYTTEEEAEVDASEEYVDDDDDEGDAESTADAIDETKAAMFQSNPNSGSSSSKASKSKVKKKAKELPKFMTEDQNDGIDRSKFAFITSGFPQAEDGLWRFENNVLGALKTYLHGTVMFYIVNTQSRSRVEKVCSSSEENMQACARLVPIYVNCPKRDYGLASCCHQDKGLASISKRYPKFEWYIYGQDDLYWRIDYLKDFTKKMPNPQKEAFLLSSSPFHAHGQVINDGIGEDQMDKKSNCSTAPGHIYPWGKPAVVYSNAALKLVQPAYENLAISKQCEAFQVPATAASPIVHWMYQLPVIQLPMISSRTPKTFAKQLMEVKKNSSGKTSKADNKQKYNPSQRYIAFRANHDRFNMTGLHEGVQAAKKAAKQFKEIPLFPQPPHNYRYHRPDGYMETEFFAEHSFPQNWTKKWYVFEPDHCVKASKTLGKNLLSKGKLDKEAVKRLKEEEKTRLRAKTSETKAKQMTSSGAKQATSSGAKQTVGGKSALRKTEAKKPTSTKDTDLKSAAAKAKPSVSTVSTAASTTDKKPVTSSTARKPISSSAVTAKKPPASSSTNAKAKPVSSSSGATTGKNVRSGTAVSAVKQGASSSKLRKVLKTPSKKR